MTTISFRQLTPQDIPDTLLDTFKRYQKTTQVFAVVDGNLIQRESNFIDNWDEPRLREVTGELRDCVQRGGIAVGAFQDDTCIGFTSVEPDRFGSNNQYVELTLCHVSREYRGNGIGKEIFMRTCDIAKSKGIEKLYLSTQPSIETQAFYRSMGCVLAEEINPEILAHEPLDIQLEKIL